MRKKTVALVAHDNMKKGLVEWAEYNVNILLDFKLVCTGTTGRLIEKALSEKMSLDPSDDTDNFNIKRLKSGPLGGDQQMGAMIAEGKIDIIIFFWDPMEAQPHDVDVKALLRIASVYNIPLALNRSTADFIISSSLLDQDYDPIQEDFMEYKNRKINL